MAGLLALEHGDIEAATFLLDAFDGVLGALLVLEADVAHTGGDESVLALLLHDLLGLNFTELSELLLEAIFVPFLRNELHVEVVALPLALEHFELSQLEKFALLFLLMWLDIKPTFGFWAGILRKSDVLINFAMELTDSFDGISLLLEAHESDLAMLAFAEGDTDERAIRLEEFAEFFFSESRFEIFNVEVVSDFAFRILGWLVSLDGDGLAVEIELAHLEELFRDFDALVADESIAEGGTLEVEADLKTVDGAESAEGRVELLHVEAFLAGQVSDEDVAFGGEELGSVLLEVENPQILIVYFIGAELIKCGVRLLGRVVGDDCALVQAHGVRHKIDLAAAHL